MAWSILPSNYDSAIAEVKANRNQIAELKRQLEEARWQLYSDGELLNKIESELLGVKYAGPYDAGIRAIKQQLAESQAREARLCDGVEEVRRYLSSGNATSAYNYIFLILALPRDDTALREYRDAVIEGCIATLEKAKIKTDNHLLRPGLYAAIKEIKLYEEAVRNISKGI